jgi:hypothetical protein
MTHIQKTFFGKITMSFLNFIGNNAPSSFLIELQQNTRVKLFQELPQNIKVHPPYNLGAIQKIVITICIIETETQKKFPKSMWLVLTKEDIVNEVRYHLKASDQEAEQIGELYLEWNYLIKEILEKTYYDKPDFWDLMEKLPGYIGA